MASDFDVKKDNQQQWCWLFNGENGETISVRKWELEYES
jgi:uncharacterized protein YegP (UPF0339 family)